MSNSALKLLAQKAKKRLSSAGQNLSKEKAKENTNKSTFAYLTNGTYAIVASRQKIEDDPLFDKVKKLIEKGNLITPLQELTNYEVFNNLSQAEKERYIIDISKRYNEIKDYILNGKTN